jgi:hypothetical protein
MIADMTEEVKAFFVGAGSGEVGFAKRLVLKLHAEASAQAAKQGTHVLSE